MNDILSGATVKQLVLHMCGVTAPMVGVVWVPQVDATGFGARLTAGPGPVTVLLQVASTAQAAASSWLTVDSITLSSAGDVVEHTNVPLRAAYARVLLQTIPNGAAVDVWTGAPKISSLNTIVGELTDAQYSGSTVTQFTRDGTTYAVSYNAGLVSTIVGGGYTWTFSYVGSNLTSVVRT